MRPGLLLYGVVPPPLAARLKTTPLGWRVDGELRDVVVLFAEVEGLEAGLLFVARSAGLTWAQIAEAMGFNSPQACQQHFSRLTTRRGGDR